MAKRGGRSGRKYVRDNRGRFATTGATARGGRLKTAGGKKRATQTVKAKTNGKPGGTLKAKPRSEGQKYAKRVQAGKDLKRSQLTARQKKFFAETQKRLDAAPLAQSRAAKPANLSARDAATARLEIKTATRRKLRADRSSVIPANPKARRVQGARISSTVAKKARAKGNAPATIANRIKRKSAVNKANLKENTRYGNVTDSKRYMRQVKTSTTLDRAQNYLKTGQKGKPTEKARRALLAAKRAPEMAAAMARLNAKRADRARAKKKSVTANSARATGKLARPVAKGNIRRTGGRLGPKNTIKPGPKSPRTKMNRAIDNVIKKGKALKGSAEKLRGVKKQADALRGRMMKEDKGRLGKALSKPSVTDKRSRDYGGRLTKGARGQDPATGGKKSRAKRGDTAEANIPMKGRRGKQLDASISKAAKQVKAAETARLIKPKAQRKSERAAKAEAKRQTAAAKPKRVRSAESLRVSRAKRITKERSISLNPAGNTQKGAGRMAANAKRTQERALAFYKGKPKRRRG
jgi:hypothetical protein